MTSLFIPPLYDVERNTEPTTVLVTGAAGYIGANLVYRLLASGHTVHGTVRHMKTATDLLALPGATDRLKLYLADLTQPGSFDEAMQGCTIVFHVASPWTLSYKGKTAASREEQFMIPAVKGTENVLDAVNRTPSVKRVVLTASIATIAHSVFDKPEGHIFTEEDWNEKSTPMDLPYYCSKTQAEKKAWEICKAQDRWTLVTVHPSLVLGPPVTSRKDGYCIHVMMDLFKNKYASPPRISCGQVDVRDVAAAHCVAAFNAKAKGRYIINNDTTTATDMARIMHDLYPGSIRKPGHIVPKALIYALGPLVGMPRDFIKWWVGPRVQFSHEKAQKELGLTFIALEQTLHDMADTMAHMQLITVKDHCQIAPAAAVGALAVATATAIILLSRRR